MTPVYLRTCPGAAAEHLAVALAADLGTGASVVVLAPAAALPDDLCRSRRIVTLHRDGRGLLAERLAAAPERTALEVLCEDLVELLEHMGADVGTGAAVTYSMDALAEGEGVAALARELVPGRPDLPRLRDACAVLAAEPLTLGRGQLFAFDAICGALNAVFGFARDRFTLEEVAGFRADLLAATAQLPAGAQQLPRLRQALGEPPAATNGSPPLGSRVVAALDRRGLLPSFFRGAAPGRR